RDRSPIYLAQPLGGYTPLARDGAQTAPGAVPSVEFGSAGQCLRIMLQERAWPESADAYDRDAVSATTVIDAGAIQAEMHTIIWSHELAELHRVLTHVSRHRGEPGPMQWATLDGRLCLTVTQTTPGQVRLAVDACDPDRAGQIRVSIAAEWPHLREWLDQLA